MFSNLGSTFTFYTSVTVGLKLKVREFLGLRSTFVEVTGKTGRGGPFCHPPPSLQSLIGLKKREKHPWSCVT